MFHAPSYPIEAMTHESIDNFHPYLCCILIGTSMKNTGFFFNLFLRILSILTRAHTHTHGERGEGFKETDSDVYPKGPNSYIHSCVKLNN